MYQDRISYRCFRRQRSCSNFPNPKKGIDLIHCHSCCFFFFRLDGNFRIEFVLLSGQCQWFRGVLGFSFLFSIVHGLKSHNGHPFFLSFFFCQDSGLDARVISSNHKHGAFWLERRKYIAWFSSWMADYHSFIMAGKIAPSDVLDSCSCT